jgi:uncharacterized membrane protein YbhN (UPF0104 family)
VSSSSSTGRQWLFFILKLAVVALVLAGIVWEVYKAKHAFAEHEFRFRDVDYRWLPVAGAAYLLGMLPMGLFWFAVMRALGQRPRLGETLRAFYIGHLGKYVPWANTCRGRRWSWSCGPGSSAVSAWTRRWPP